MALIPSRENSSGIFEKKSHGYCDIGNSRRGQRRDREVEMVFIARDPKLNARAAAAAASTSTSTSKSN